ncbi:DMT family transporter [Paenibacillus sp. sptzw28]|uniref:DMT family transporter n=1 Tax=Paenibacillus sp. sptzw28 TaxID=715179 RepID=UPI001C6EA4CC|nr:DMT family transporter [Paenibacillus sp. sptzw28]QYR20916.1 DMT family transporter [Paenibacillus sp. sptzw28]
MVQLSRTQTAVYLAFLVTVWGVNWPLSKFALDFAPPILFAGLRIFIGGLLLLFFALPRYKKLNLKNTWHIYLISSMLNIIVFYVFQTFGLKYVPAGLFAAIVFFQPVLLGICSWLWLGEAMSFGKMIGLILGFLGVAAISLSGGSGHISSVGILLGLGSAVSWTTGTLYMKKTAARVDAMWVVALQIVIGGIVLLVLGSSIENWNEIVWNIPFIWSLMFISIFVTALGWLAFFKLVGSGEAGKVGSFTFLIPLTSIMISVIFLGETVTMKLTAGLFLIIAGIALVNFKPKASALKGAK